MLLERMSIGIPNPRKIMDRIKNIIMVFVSVGTGCQAFNICCLNWSKRVTYSSSFDYRFDYCMY